VTEPTGPTESDQQRLTRNVSELLQELRVAQAGVQILFGFLLAVAFTEPYQHGSRFLHIVHLITVLISTASIALLVAPAAWHRMLFRKGQRPEILRAANTFAVAGLICLAGAMTGTVLLIADVVVGRWPAIVIAAVIAIGFAWLWFVSPPMHRRR
jgi:uncharacterized protein DUF6328